MNTYDQQYKEQHLFGDPYPEFVEFIDKWERRGAALDMGCGQGRDALMLAAKGFAVTGVDSSRVGIDQMLTEAKRDGLEITGVVADIFDYKLSAGWDLILFDSMFHFEKKDRQRELDLLDRAARHLNMDGLLCIFVHKSNMKESLIRNLLVENHPDIVAIFEDYIDYVYEEKSSDFRTEMQYSMLIYQRTA